MNTLFEIFIILDTREIYNIPFLEIFTRYASFFDLLAYHGCALLESRMGSAGGAFMEWEGLAQVCGG